MTGFILALQFLTRVPTPRVKASEEDFAASMRWFPAVGLVIGALVAGTAWLLAPIDSWVAALAALCVWTGVTGALHLDGLGDYADASGAAHKDRERVLAVLADPHVGSFGVVAIALQLVAKLVLLHAMVEARLFLPLLLTAFAARIGPLVWTHWLPSLHAGLAARFQEAIRPVHIAIWAVALAGAAWVAPALLAAPLAIGWWGWHVRKTLGGISGDGHGAGIELVETILLFASLCVARWL